jgi:uncharacterized membrane protein YqjE
VSSSNEPYEIQEPERSLGELVGRLSSEIGELVRTHLDLAKAEMKQEAKQAGRGAGMLGGGAVAGHLAILLLSFAAAWGLAEVVHVAVAFLLVGLVWVAVAIALGAMGRRELNEVHPAPEETIEELQEDKRWMRQQAS